LLVEEEIEEECPRLLERNAEVRKKGNVPFSTRNSKKSPARILTREKNSVVGKGGKDPLARKGKNAMLKKNRVYVIPNQPKGRPKIP